MMYNQHYISSLFHSDAARPAHLQGDAWLARLKELDSFVQNGVQINSNTLTAEDQNESYQRYV
jgi:hypothetical protein